MWTRESTPAEKIFLLSHEKAMLKTLPWKHAMVQLWPLARATEHAARSEQLSTDFSTDIHRSWLLLCQIASCSPELHSPVITS